MKVYCCILFTGLSESYKKVIDMPAAPTVGTFIQWRGSNLTLRVRMVKYIVGDKHIIATCEPNRARRSELTMVKMLTDDGWEREY